MITKELEQHLQSTNPALLAQLRAATAGTPAKGVQIKGIQGRPLTALERDEMARIQAALDNPEIAPELRGQLAQRALELNGFGGMFPAAK